jgi:hypothetical protein
MSRLSMVGVGVVAAVFGLSAARADAGSMYVHSARSGQFAGGRLTLHGVGRKVTWVTTVGSTGVAPISLVQKRLFSHKMSATGVLGIAGKRRRGKFAFRLSGLRYSAARRSVSYRATPLIKRAGAAGVPRRFGIASLSVVPATPLGGSGLGASPPGTSRLGGGDGGNDCVAYLFNLSNQSEDLYLQSSSKWDTDDWAPSPPATIDYNSGAFVGSAGGFLRGCHNESVWASNPPGSSPGQATITIDVSWPWSTVAPYSTCTASNPGLYRCVRDDQAGEIRWEIDPG